MTIIGKPTINPFFFFTGKISGYTTWILCLLSILGLIDLSMISLRGFHLAGFILLGLGLLITVLSMINLGKSTTLGLPEKETELTIKGLYRISRNPMYLGFDLITLGSVLYIQNPFVLAAGLYSIIIYHFIILSEEKFLLSRFGSSYEEFAKRIRRYL